MRDNANKIDALNLVVTRPRDLTRESLRELRLVLDARHFRENDLRQAWRDRTNEDIAASIIGFIRQAALGDPLIPYADRVDRAIRKVASTHDLDDVQRRWLDRIGDEMKSQVVIDRQAFDDPPFAQQGGYRRLNKIFGGELDAILEEIRTETWEPAA